MTINDNGQNLVTLVEKASAEDLFVSRIEFSKVSFFSKFSSFLQSFLQQCHRKPFSKLDEVYQYQGVIDDEIDFIDTTATKYQITPLIIAAGKGPMKTRRSLDFSLEHFSFRFV